MTGVIDYWCNLFTPEGIRACFTEQEELAEVFRWWKLEDHLAKEVIAWAPVTCTWINRLACRKSMTSLEPGRDIGGQDSTRR
jgi:hypothetical protein